ncbi:MAG: beta strand repeat-containing protein, partial [Terriglobales bacterium]
VLWFTTTADSGDSSWQGWILSSAGYPVSSVALDPTDPTGGSAYATVMGFGGIHVWKLTGGADPNGPFFQDITGDLPDAPADSIAIDPVDPTIIYVGTDVGVFKTQNNGVNWFEYGPNLPNVPVTKLRTFNVGPVHELRASTYGRGVWKISLASSVPPDYHIKITNPSAGALPNATGVLQGSVIFDPGYSGTVTLSCGSGAPTTCSFNQSSFSSPGTFSLNVADSSVQTFNFNIHGDDGSVQHDTATTFDVFDFEIQSVSPATLTIPRGTNAEWTVTLKSLGAFNRTVDVGCGAVPSSVFCSAFIENTVRPGAPVDDKLFVQTQPSTAVANTPLNIRACWAGSCKTAPANLNIVLNPHFTLQMSPGIAHVVRGGTTTFTLTASPHDGYTSSNITLSCISPPASVSCQFDMNPISETGTAILTVSAGPTAPLSEQWFIVQGDDGAGDVTTAQEFLAIDDFTVAGTPASQTVTSGNSASYTANTTDLSSTIPITIGCTNLPAGASCLAVPPVVSAGSSSTVTVSTTSGTTLPSTATFHITGTSLGVTRSSANLSLKTTDFQVTSTTPSTSVNAGSNGTISVNVKALNGYAKPVALSCSSLPVNVTCTFSTNNFTPASTGTAVTVTLHTTAAVPFGIYNTISLDALGDAQTHSIPLVLTVKDFHLSLNPTTVTLPLPAAGQTTATPAMVTFFADQGFNSVVTPSCVAPPTGVTCAFNPTTVTPTLAGANTTLTLTQTSVAASATTPLTIKGAAGTTLNHTQSLTVTTGGHNFTQAVTPTTQNVTAGSSANYTVVYTPLGGMTEDIVVACGALPLGVTCTPVPPVVTPGVTPGNQSIVALTTTFGTTPGANATVAISGVSAALNNLTRSTNVTLSVKDFTVTANTATIATNVGSNITDTILVKGLNGFTGVVALTCVIEGTPTGTACNLSNANPVASAAGTSVTATITSNAGTTPQGTYTVDVTGTNSGQQKIASFTVNIKDFSLGLGVNEITIPQPPPGQSSSLTVPITLTALNGFNSSASLSCSGQPAGVTCAFTPASGIPTALGLASTLKVTSTSAVTANTYHLQIKATAGTLIRTQPLDVTDFGPNFTETVTPITQNVTAGASAAYTVTFAPLGGMNQAILVGCGVLPAGVTCTPVPAVVTPGTTPGNQSIVTLQTTFAVTPGANAMVAISGVSSGIGVTRSTNVTLAVKDFTVTANTGTVATNVGTNITDTILVKGLNGFTGSVPLTCTIDTAPAGMGCALSNANPAASAAGSSVTATISSNMATTPHGVYTVHVAGTVSGQVKTATFAVTVKDFTLALDAPAFTIPQPPSGQSNSASTGVTITPLTGFGSTITFSCSGLPAGMTCSFATPGLVAVNATSAVVHGTYPITVKATAGTLVRQTNIDVTAFGPNFIQAVTPATQNVNAGSAAQYTVIYTPLGGMTDDITVGCGALLPAGVTCTPLPATANPGNGYQSVVTLQTTFGTTPAANATVFISGVSAAQNNLTRSNNVTLAVKDFSVIRNTPIVTTNVGTNITDTVVVKALNGFTGNVALACAIEGAPAGATCTLSNLNPAATSNGTSVTATITSTAATTPPGSYLIDVTGTTLAGSHGRQFTVNIKDFSLDIQPETQSITATGATVFADYTLTATALNGFNSSATLTCVTPLPTGVTCGFGASHSSSMSVVPTGAGLVIPFRITVSGSTAPHTHELTIRGSSGTLIRTDGAELQLQ